MQIRPLICKLEQFAPLSDEDKRLLEDAASDLRDFDRRQNVIWHGDRPDHVHLVVEGWAARYKTLPEGDQPIMAYRIPGDFGDILVSLLSRMDHSIRTLSPCKITFIPRRVVTDLLDNHPSLSRALWWSTLLDEAILRERAYCSRS